MVPVAANTLLTTRDFDFMLRDARAQGLIVSQALLPQFEPLIGSVPSLRTVVVGGVAASDRFATIAQLSAAGDATPQPVVTSADDACFWLYSSGSTGTPKGTVHLHSHLIQTAELYGRAVLGIRENDVVYSAAKLFFAYGLGNALTFPLAVGATTVLFPGRPTPGDVFGLLQTFRPTVFYGVPTLYAGLLAHAERPARSALNLRVCTSAGEALPAEIGRKWTAEYGCEILDGIGSTEMLHIFLSNRPGKVRYGTTGSGRARLPLAHRGRRRQGMRRRGDWRAADQRPHVGPDVLEQPRQDQGHLRRRMDAFSGDKYTRDADGYYTYGGRTDDMLKVGGIYVSPFEVEASVMTHPAVLEAAVIGVADTDELTKPKAFVVLKAGQTVTADDLKAHVKSQLAPYKYPRWIEFVAELPKTATGKIQRFKLREKR